MKVISFKHGFIAAATLMCAGINGEILAQPAPAKTIEAPKPAQAATDPGMPVWLRPERGNSFENAALAPLNDLNLRKANIPEILIEAIKTTYNLDGLDTCKSLATEIQALDQVLGEDFDEQAAVDNSTLSQKGEKLAGNTAKGMVRGTSTSLIPFRGIMRKVTGAEHHEREVNTAIEAGTVRRAYLKGIGVSKNCAPPAAPSWFIPRAETAMPAKPKSGRKAQARPKS